MSIDDDKVEILSDEQSTKYLGRKLTFHDYHHTELANRIAMAWRKFNQLHDELTSKRYPLHSRLRLFSGAVTPTVMHGCTSWTLTKDLLLTLRRAQRRMLRLIVNTPRRRESTQQKSAADDDAQSNPARTDADTSDITIDAGREFELDDVEDDTGLEPWEEFIRRATHAATDLAARFHVDEWTTVYYRRKWRWAQRVATHSHLRWTRLAAAWEPEVHDNRTAQRRHGGQRKRWCDDISQFIQMTRLRQTQPLLPSTES